jgi:hypothetical protein
VLVFLRPVEKTPCLSTSFVLCTIIIMHTTLIALLLAIAFAVPSHSEDTQTKIGGRCLDSLPHAPESGVWAEKLNNMAICAWQTKIESAFTNGRSTRFLLEETEAQWIITVLLPILVDRGLKVSIEYEQWAKTQVSFLCVRLQ